MKNVIFPSTLFVFAFISPLLADSFPVAATASFTGINNTWNFSYTSGDPGIFLQQITIDLSPTDVRFDSAPGGFGSLGSQDVGNFGGTDTTTGLTTISATGAALDGGSLLTFTLANLTAGDNFTFSVDVDHPNPTLQNLANCGILSGLAKVGCLASNAVKTGANNLALLGADTVLSAQLANAEVTFQFGGPGFITDSVTGPLQAPTISQIVNGLRNGDGGGSFSSNTGITDQVNLPEPGTWAMGAAGLALFCLRRRKSA
jgi:MYXO-CTERM domain-containing protein